MKSEELIHELPKGLLKWYGFKKGGNALYITADAEFDHALSEALQEAGLKTECRKPDELCMLSDKYDYAIMAVALTCEKRPEELLKSVYDTLKCNGTFFLCADNRLGIRYFCGDRDPFTHRSFDGVENYKRVSDRDMGQLAGRLYSKAELINMLENAGFYSHRFYSVFPEIMSPQILFADGYMPNEELRIRLFPYYHDPNIVFLEEENLYSSLIQNEMFHTMANGFLIECPLNDQDTCVNQITVSMDRGRENALFTIIRQDGKVEKKPAYKEGCGKAERLMENNLYLQKHGVKMIEAEIKGDSFVMPYIKGVPLAQYFRLLAGSDLQEFYKQLDTLWDMILSSSEHVAYENVDWEHFDPWWDEEQTKNVEKKIDRSIWRKAAFETGGVREALGPILQRGYIDLVLLNGFSTENGFIFYDQEMYMEHLPARAIMLRNIDFLYRDTQMQWILSREELLERYHIDKYQQIYYAYIRYYLTKLRNDDILQEYHKMHRCDGEIIHTNRQRMNYSAVEYQKLFVDIFKNIENKRIYLFGSGKFTKKFLALYGEEYEITGILDNDASKWGSSVEGNEILSPSVLLGQDVNSYKVIICIKNYTGVLAQIKKMGVYHIGIYDPNKEYPRKQNEVINTYSVSGQEKKKYHVGYVAGVFDLFHIGHVNLFKRAKEQCDYLIVGVVTDEGVRLNKHTESYIPFEERLAVVRACRYVDEAVGIPLEYSDTKDAYLKFQFDVQFSGSDYVDDPVWLGKKKFLQEHGADLVFFPYTESTSSSKIKSLIEKRRL